MRVAMNRLMITKWRALGSFQAHFVPAMLEPFLKMSMITPTGTIIICCVHVQLEFDGKLNLNYISGNPAIVYVVIHILYLDIPLCVAIRLNTIMVFYDMMTVASNFSEVSYSICHYVHYRSLINLVKSVLGRVCNTHSKDICFWIYLYYY